MRVFAGLPLDTGSVEAIERWRAPLLARWPRLKWVSPRQFHVSIHFFGELEPSQVDGIAEAMRLIEAEAIEASLGDAGCFPPVRSKPPRVLYVSLDQGREEVQRLQGEFMVRMEPLGHKPERRDYTPHVTLARAKGDVYDLRSVREGPASPVHFDRFVLYESKLGPQGSQYLPVETIVLDKRKG